MIDHTLGTLYVVATPIGNLGDMSPRAIDVLKTVDIIAAEDTRHSGKLLQNFGISTKLIAYHDHSNQQRLQKILGLLEAGQSVALISDAGTPLISDPGYELVRLARASGATVSPVPGACALIAALSVSGLSTQQFVFEGFLPSKASARRQSLFAFKYEHRTSIFYESPHRIVDCLHDIQVCLGSDRELVVAREITKTYETVLSGTVAEIIERVHLDANQQRGEFVLMLAGVKIEAVENPITQEVETLMRALMPELPINKASAITAKITGSKKRDIYQWALEEKI